MGIMDASPGYPRKLLVGVWAAIFILTMAFADFLSHFLPIYDHDWVAPIFLGGGIAVFIAGLCGAFCGLSSLWKVHGFSRMVAVLTALVSVYGVIRCLGFLAWAINLL